MTVASRTIEILSRSSGRGQMLLTGMAKVWKLPFGFTGSVVSSFGAGGAGGASNNGNGWPSSFLG